LRCGGCWGK